VVSGGLTFFFHAEFAELRGDVGTVGVDFDFLIDGENLAVGTDVERPALGGFALGGFVSKRP